MSESRVFLVRTSTDEAVDAVLTSGIGASQVLDTENSWKAWREERYARNPELKKDESDSWNWDEIAKSIEGQLGFPAFSLTCEGKTQGLMVLKDGGLATLPSQKDKSLIYVALVAAAPWNRRKLTPTPLFTGVGSTMINVAVQTSLDFDYDGRIGLHSLPQSEGFYRDKCGMTDCGIDPKKHLRYFEMTEEQARTFIGSNE
ncbi:MAG: GNAT family N-acetyltransferase [Pirellula sp.]|nr:GNAT family N-acetyltransferase [Pirellula sp.]